MRPGRGRKSGLTDDEQKRNDSTGSNAAAESETAEPGGSQWDAGDQRAAGETAVRGLSKAGAPKDW